MNVHDYSGLFILVIPQVVVVIAALAVLLVDFSGGRAKPLPTRMRRGALVTVLGCALALAALTQTAVPGRHIYGDGMLVYSPLTALVEAGLLLLTIFTALLSIEATFTRHAGEYYAILLLASAGMMFLVSSENLLLIFLALELLSLCLYILTAFNKQNVRSAEAALKYFLFGAMSAAFLLFGLSLLYGLSGEINLARMAAKLRGSPLDPLLVLALLMVLTGFGFKVAAVPFHLWAPDAYQGAPTPSAAFIASGSKLASFFVFSQVLVLGLPEVGGRAGWHDFAQGWLPMLAVVAALSMLLGNLAAMAQKSVRRLLAYSAIAQGGYMLLGILAQGGPGSGHQALASLLYYVFTYGLTVIGAFGVVAAVENSTGSDDFSAFSGLRSRAPVLSSCMLVFMLSLAGIPPLAGFFGKFYVFVSALELRGNLSLLWLVVLAVALSAVSLYYYLQVLKQVFVAERPPGSAPLPGSFWTTMAVTLLALGVVALGCMPNLLLGRLMQVLKSSIPAL